MKRTIAAIVLLTVAMVAVIGAWSGCDAMRAAPPREAARDPEGDNPDNPNAPPRAGVDDTTKYTILLSTYTGPNHAANAKKIKDRAGTSEGLPPATELMVVHKDNGSDLYWNRTYGSAEEARPDLMKARNFRLANEDRPIFPGAITVAMMPAEYGPAKWNLKNATWEYEFTILVGEYEDSQKHHYVGKRIKDCVEHVRQLREKGYEAYYYHDAGKSLVTVGLFVEGAAPQAILGYKTDRSGQKIPVYGQKIVDPRIEKLMKTTEPPLCYMAWNGHTLYSNVPDKNGKKTIRGSALISIPRSASEGRKVLEMRLRATEEQRRRDIDSLEEPRQVPRNP